MDRRAAPTIVPGTFLRTAFVFGTAWLTLACTRDDGPRPIVPERAVDAVGAATAKDATAPRPAKDATKKDETKDAGRDGAGPDAAATCGTKPLPDCPLQAWMKANAAPALASKDFFALDEVLGKAAGFAPPEFRNWSSIARDGADAARSQDLAATKAACVACHDQFKAKYKESFRTRDVP
ncbi:MAG: hypothetical protein U0169_14825 [Polyangiaceae bacterium]